MTMRPSSNMYIVAPTRDHSVVVVALPELFQFLFGYTSPNIFSLHGFKPLNPRTPRWLFVNQHCLMLFCLPCMPFKALVPRWHRAARRPWHDGHPWTSSVGNRPIYISRPAAWHQLRWQLFPIKVAHDGIKIIWCKMTQHFIIICYIRGLVWLYNEIPIGWTWNVLKQQNALLTLSLLGHPREFRMVPLS